MFLSSVLTQTTFKTMKKVKFLVPALFVATAFSFSSCSEDDEDTIVDESNILELAQGNSDLSSLVAAATRAGLVDELSDENANLTVFAPTNAAFAAFLSANGFSSVDEVPVDLLTQILLNHVVGSEVEGC
jgi:transforming growth factor-beta-induced protein